MTAQSDADFNPAINLRQATVSLLCIGIVCLVASIVAQVWELWHIAEVGIVAAMNDTDSPLYQWQSGASTVITLFLWGGGILFLFWLYRARINLPALNNDTLEYSPGWTFGAFILPFANVILPVLVIREIYRGSDPSELTPDSENGLTPRHGKYPIPQLLTWWWFCTLVPKILSVVMNVVGEGMADRVFEIGRMSIFIDVLQIVGLLLTIKLVLHITKMQAERYALINPGGLMSCE